MTDEPPYILDITGLEEESASAEDTPDPGRKWVGIKFECCGVYARLYRNKKGTAYEGYCPRCARPVRVRIGPGGTSHRMFRAY